MVDKLVGSGRQRCVQNLDVKCILRITELHSHHSDQEVLYRDFQVGDVFKGSKFMGFQPVKLEK